jgi:methylase of polypeptide subunit release factors
MDVPLARLERPAAKTELFGTVARASSPLDGLDSEPALAAACAALIGDLRGLSPAEASLLAPGLQVGDLRALRRVAVEGDPLGEAFERLRPAVRRRRLGAVYTPGAIVAPMVEWIGRRGAPQRIVDPGAGSGRFILAAARAYPDAQLVAIELDPLASLVLRANLALHGFQDRTLVVVGDYRDLELAAIDGVTAFVGNPPYVRHHDIGAEHKRWYREACAALGVRGSALAGLHLHFFAKTALLARDGDLGVFVTAAEWLDVNYGAALRELLTGRLAVESLEVLAPTVSAFPGTATTAAITAFRAGTAPMPVQLRTVPDAASLAPLGRGQATEPGRLRAAARWSVHLQPPSADRGGEIELGELFRVHRGQVTGANGCWIAGRQADALPTAVLQPTVTRAADLFAAGATLASALGLRRVVDLPPDLERFARDERAEIDAYLAWAKARGADRGYIARHRRAWWSVGLRAPAPILCTYMARRPPQFSVNACGARHINIAHGLYPREPMAAQALDRLVAWLNAHVTLDSGRVYAGGLTKFEPKEIERLRIPRLESLGA